MVIHSSCSHYLCDHSAVPLQRNRRVKQFHKIEDSNTQSCNDKVQLLSFNIARNVYVRFASAVAASHVGTITIAHNNPLSNLLQANRHDVCYPTLSPNTTAIC